jgi:hypothetical protein
LGLDGEDEDIGISHQGAILREGLQGITLLEASKPPFGHIGDSKGVYIHEMGSEEASNESLRHISCT